MGEIDIYLPTLHSFAMNNIFTGSCGKMRFRIAPSVVKKSQKEVDMEQSLMVAEVWHGELCYEKSTMETKAEFPMSEQGRADLKKWLENQV